MVVRDAAWWTVMGVQAILGMRVAVRLIRTASGRRIRPRGALLGPHDHCSVIVPVLNERHRLPACLAGLATQGAEVTEILVVDGGSEDGTGQLVLESAVRDARVQLLDATPVPADWNGKAWGLQVGVDRSDARNPWVLTIDADVRPEPGLIAALLAHAHAEGVTALSAATRQRLSGAAEGVVHPALLTTLVYRFGIPGHVARSVAEAQANGQCFLVWRDTLARSGGFTAVRDSICEDVTLARRLVAAGGRVGFYETDGLVSVAMYADWRDAWRNWTRSLPLRDRHWGTAGPLGLAEVALVQALPLPLTIVLWSRGRGRELTAVARAALVISVGLTAMRFGVLAGMGRAYERRPWTYWLSPLADVPVAVALVVSASRRRHRWRGREIVRG